MMQLVILLMVAVIYILILLGISRRFIRRSLIFVFAVGGCLVALVRILSLRYPYLSLNEHRLRSISSRCGPRERLCMY